MSDDRMYPVGTLQTGDITWEVKLAHHEFRATAEGMRDCYGSTWAELENNCKVQASRARVRVSVPYAYVTWEGFKANGTEVPVLKRGTATGIHASNGSVLATEDGKPQQLRNDWSSTGWFMPPEPDDAARLLDLAVAEKRIKDERRALIGKYTFTQGTLHSQVAHEIELARARKQAEDGGDQAH